MLGAEHGVMTQAMQVRALLGQDQAEGEQERQTPLPP
jgi:hypothetical protein